MCVGLASPFPGQQPHDWLEEVSDEQDAASDWLNTFFTFLYGVISPSDSDETEEDEEERRHGRADSLRDEDEEEDEEDERERQTRRESKLGQKVVIVGLQNQ
uniref:Uncharacterized protein n=1 Tax=Knipowitschia caucasica TaxID=637954 RepID=A0AAV2JUE1_KNICA